MKKFHNKYIIWVLIPLIFLLILSIVTSNGISVKKMEITPYTLYGAFFFCIFLLRWFIRKKPIKSSKRKKVICRILDKVREKFPIRPGQYQIPEDIEIVLKENPHDEHAIEALLKDIHYYLGLDISQIRCDIRYIHDYDSDLTEDKENPAGCYMDCGDGTRNISIYLRKSYNLFTITSIVAHETMHHFLQKHKIGYSNIEENELLTDIAALYLGFAEYMAKGNHDLYDGGNRFIRVGYLTKEEIHFLIKKMQEGNM